MDKYTKKILTVIAIGIIGINLQMLGDKIITPAEASSHIQKVQICNWNGSTCATTTSVSGGYGLVRDGLLVGTE